jgi:myo-inositol-1(or 4)-monophosphatase
MSGECFTAAAQRGAFLNGSRIRASSVRTLSDALIVAGFPAAVTPNAPDLRLFNEIVLASQSVRRTGSAALNLAYVAAGRFDAGWSFSTKVWDVAAGILLIEEAGGVATSPEGLKHAASSGTFLVAATQELHAELLALVRRLGLHDIS